MATYPNEVWPADSTVLEADGSLDVATGLPFIAKGTGPTSNPSYEVQYNRRQMRQNRILAGWRQGMVVDEGGLKIGAYPMDYTFRGEHKHFAGATGLAVPDNAQRVVYVDDTVTLRVATAWPVDPTSYLPLAEITTATGVLTIADRCVYAAFSVPAERRYITVACSQVGSNQNALKVYEFDPPRDMVVEEIQVFCTAVAATVSVDVRKAGTSMLASSAVPTSGGVVKPAISDGFLPGSSNMAIHVTTNATGSVSNLLVTLIVRG